MKWDRWLALFCLSRILVTLVTMTYPGTLAALRPAWGMSAAEAGSISTGYFCGSTAAFVLAGWLADRYGARRSLAAWTWFFAGATVLWALAARSHATALPLYTAVGVGQGATYAAALIVIALRYPKHERGRAVGWSLASMSLGAALSMLVCGLALTWSDGDYRLAFAIPAVASLAGLGLLHLALREVEEGHAPAHGGSHDAEEAAASRRAVRLLTWGYVGHAWETTGATTWIPAFVTAALAAHGAPPTRAVAHATYIAAGLHLAGLLSLYGFGALSDRIARRTLLITLGAAGAAGSLLFGWTMAAPVVVIALSAALYKVAVLGDSPILSVSLTESVPPSRLGRALAVRGFLSAATGAMAPAMVGVVLDFTGAWGWGFSTLALGGLLATACALALPRPAGEESPEAARPEGKLERA